MAKQCKRCRHLRKVIGIKNIKCLPCGISKLLSDFFKVTDKQRLKMLKIEMRMK